MKNIFIGSSEPRSGKSGLCVGLGSILKDRGLSVGYMKPVGSLARAFDGTFYEDDAVHAKEALDLSDSPEKICPILLSEELVEAALKGKKTGFKERITKAFKEVSTGKDVVLLEGLGDISGGAMFDLSDPEVAKLLNSKIILVARYDSDYVIDRILRDMKLIGDGKQLVGVVFSDVSEKHAERIRKKVAPFLAKKGVKVLGTIPQDPLLKSATVEDIAEELGGKIICGDENKKQLVKTFIVGAMSPEHALKYFRRTTDKAVITGGDRSDIILAALETPTKCVILTGNLRPSATVLARAEESGTPLVIVPHDTVATVYLAENLIGKISAWEGEKLARIKKLMKENIDLKTVFKELGVRA